MQQNKYSAPRHMSRSALPIMYVNFLKTEWQEFLGLVLLIVFTSKELSILQRLLVPFAVLILYLIYAAVRTFLNYYFFKFHISNGNLIVQKGILHKQTVNIPTYKIHSLRTNSGFFYRLFDMKGISADTLADKQKEVELILDDADWNELLVMFKDEKTVGESTSHDDRAEQQTPIASTHDIVCSNASLIKGALCQNHLKGTVVMAVILFNILLQIDDSILSIAAEYAMNEARTISFTLTSILILIVIIYLISIVLWLAKIVLRYYSLKINLSSDKLFFEGGLITRRSIRFAFDKVCTIRVKTNPLEQLMHCSTVNLKQAFNVTSEKEQNDVLIYGSNITDKFLEWWLGSSYRESQLISELHSGRGLFWYSFKYPLLATLVVAALLYNAGLYQYIVLLGILLLIFIIQSLFQTRRSKIIIREKYLELHNGSFAEVTNYIKYHDIETVAVRHTPFTPYFHRVHLLLSTNGTGYVVRSLRQKDAMAVYDYILSEIHSREI